ncbi:class I SAM-dependent methyltransferase [Nitratifractor salsuginis]|uniref:Methyltransferase type 12 n=1 Tax=Nitratifractor salsuginis (strain DSM 16511 / JCM 12458 / E9I37-1) TaxID=749222 RepID=E6WY08_NITSE|nr:class I SAM-dependent methyltransferase [Nitratifractor salsuginis]ADV46382.1 Methyltransferase type 12 [Nitratifractor salsuginis DSM 16511]
MSFDKRAENWDALDRRQALAETVARVIIQKIDLNPSMHLLDLGAGTGLLARRLAPYVGKVVAVDTSSGMLQKLSEVAPEIERVHSDILSYRPEEKFDGIVSSMTLHHIEDTQLLMRHLRSLLKEDGFIALADLAPEKGDFHDGGNEGVYHFGFDEATLSEAARKAGFGNVSYELVHTVNKGEGREYDIFLLTAWAGNK